MPLDTAGTSESRPDNERANERFTEERWCDLVSLDDDTRAPIRTLRKPYRDLSRGGAGLLISEHFEPGQIVAIRILERCMQKHATQILFGEVKYSIPAGDNGWHRTGIEFIHPPEGIDFDAIAEAFPKPAEADAHTRQDEDEGHTHADQANAA